MYYKQYGDTDMKVSAIGFGCMRYPDEDVAAGNFEKCAELPLYAYEQGINYFEESVELIETVTQFTSCEYAVRPFIIRYGNKMMKQMQLWSLHKSHHVRRLASEGSRPRSAKILA